MNETGDDNLNRAVTELGDPDAIYGVSRGRYVAKLGLGAVLVLYGIVANYYWWVHGPGRIGHFELGLLIVVPLTGVSLLWHMYRNRGLSVLVYSTGILRLRRGEVDSLTWDEIAEISMKVKRAESAEFERDDYGQLTVGWLPVDVPAFRVWDSGMTVTRDDRSAVQFGAVLAGFDELAETIQRRTFARLWPGVWNRFKEGKQVRFGDLTASWKGLRYEKKFLPWAEFSDMSIAQEKLNIKQKGRWLPWLLKDVKSIPNLHLLFGLVKEAKRASARASKHALEDGAGTTE